jgi:hypothetical protein
MSTNDTVRMQAGILVIGYDPGTASCTVRILSNSDGFEVVGAAAAAASGCGDALAETEPAGEPPPLPGSAGSVCAASVQHNFRAGRHPGRCKPGRHGCR